MARHQSVRPTAAHWAVTPGSRLDQERELTERVESLRAEYVLSKAERGGAAPRSDTQKLADEENADMCSALTYYSTASASFGLFGEEPRGS